MKRRRWTQEEVALLQSVYHLYRADRIGAMLGRTGEAVKVKAVTLGITCRKVPTLYTCQQLAKACGVKHQSVTRWIKNGIARPIGDRYQPLFTREEVERVTSLKRRRYAPEGWIASTVVAKELGYTPTGVTLWCRRGLVESVKIGRRWYLRADAVEDIKRRMKDSGRLTMDWRRTDA